MMDSLVWHTEQRRVKELVPWEGNPRQLSEKEASDLTASLSRLNLIDIPAIDVDGTLVGGHQRAKILLNLGRAEEMIDVRVPNRKLSEAEYVEANIRLNKNLGSWDFGGLANLDEKNLLEFGFSDEELKVGFGLHGAEDSLTDLDRYCVLTVEPPESPRLKMRMSFYCDTIEEYEKIKAVFISPDVEGNELDKEKFMSIVHQFLAAR
jgi:hypothetical protein